MDEEVFIRLMTTKNAKRTPAKGSQSQPASKGDSGNSTLTGGNSPVDLSYLEAVSVRLPEWNELQIVLVGCGGTGSWLAPHLARLVKVLQRQDQGKQVSLTFVDHDRVEDQKRRAAEFFAGRGGVAQSYYAGFTLWGSLGGGNSGLHLPLL